MAAWQKKAVIGDCVLYLGDCLEVMKELDPVDAVVTDPPYGVNLGRGFGGGGKGLAGRRDKHVRKYKNGDWDKKRPPRESFDCMISLASAHIVWGGNYFTDYLPVSGKWLFWDKVQTMPTYSDGELAWTTLQGDAVKQFTYNGSGFHAKEKERVHPTQKPLALMRWCLEFLPDAKSVLDPFMGSGSTGVVCAKMGRKFVGIELDPDYYEIACKRVEEAYKQPDLFVAPPSKPVQESMF